MQTPPTDAERRAVADALERVFGWLRENREPAGLSASALSALSRLDSSGALRVTELSAREGLTQPGMTTLINRLEDAGYAVREADPDDGRAVRVRITPAGSERVREHHSTRSARVAARIAELSPADQAALVAALDALTAFPDDHSRTDFPKKTEEAR